MREKNEVVSAGVASLRMGERDVCVSVTKRDLGSSAKTDKVFVFSDEELDLKTAKELLRMLSAEELLPNSAFGFRAKAGCSCGCSPGFVGTKKEEKSHSFFVHVL